MRFFGNSARAKPRAVFAMGLPVRLVLAEVPDLAVDSRRLETSAGDSPTPVDCQQMFQLQRSLRGKRFRPLSKGTIHWARAAASAHSNMVPSGLCIVPPPPHPRVQEPPCARTAPWFRGRIFHITFFCQGNGFFMVLVDVGQLFRCAGQHFHVCCYGSPHQGGPYQSVTVAHTP